VASKRAESLNFELQTRVPSFFCNRNNNISFLLEHKHMLRMNCEREEEKAAELELRSRLFSFGEFNSDAQVPSWPVVTLFCLPVMIWPPWVLST
jgi:hypothetical protein